MMKPILMMAHHLYLPLFLHMTVLATLVAGNSPPLYNRVEDITVKCGYPGQLHNRDDGRTWVGDINSKFSPIDHQAPTNTSTSLPAPISSDKVSYSSARLSHSPFTYTFNLIAGQKFIRFYFYADSYCPGFDRSKALFSVKAGRFTLLKDFNSSVTADVFGFDKFEENVIYREFCLNIGEDEPPSLNITFAPSTEIPDAYAFVNGIEIVSMPTNLYYNNDSQVVGSESNNFQIENSSALATVYRINNGGGTLFYGEDNTGMYRYWDGSDIEERYYLDYLIANHSFRVPKEDIQLDFSIENYSAPEEVYKSARTMGDNQTENKSYNLTWLFPLDSMFHYLVRLHFCAIESEIRNISDRTFSIFMAGQLAEDKADVIRWSGGNGKPVYKDYMIYIPPGPGGRDKDVNLSLELQPNPDYQTTRNINAFLNGIEIFKLNDTISNLAGPNPPPPKNPPKAVPLCSIKTKPASKNNHARPLILAIVGGGVVIASALVVVGFLVFRRRGRAARKYERSSYGEANSTKSRGSTLPAELCYSFSLAEIKAATQNFNDICIIGHGGFGNVYKGYIDLDGGATPVAVKRLKPESSQGAMEFKTEIEMLSQLRHRHLVPLVGYCTEKGEMILVYDYMAHGTLRDHLYNTENPPLSWEQRLDICIGAGRGLQYLHSGVKYTIIHRDVKSTNILLDEKWVARVSDFGLSKMGTTTMSNAHISTMVKGSFGYLDPEYYRRQQLTEKSDVYSFGVVLCEVLCARPALLRTVEKKKMTSLAEWAKSCHRNGKLDQIMDPSLRGKIATPCFNKFAEIAVSCMHDNGTERPSMSDVVRGLEFALELQQSGDEEDIMMNNIDVVSKIESEINLLADFTSSTTGKSTTTTTTLTNESMKGMSGTIFSEMINNSNGR